MQHIEIESTIGRDVYRCFPCDVRRSQVSPVGWVFIGARMLLFLVFGVPPDPDDILS